MAAINQVVDEKGLTQEQVIETIEAAIAAAYRRDYAKPDHHIEVKFNVVDASFKVYRAYDVVATEEEITERARELTLEAAKEIDKKAVVGEQVREELPHQADFGRIAAQTAKQVIIQRLREAERDVLFNEFKNHELELMVGTVQQVDGKNVVINLGKINGIMIPREQVPTEEYHVGQRLKVLVKEVADTGRGLQVIVSRSDPRLISALFKKEVPEIDEGAVEIKAVAREAGSRTKIAIYTEVDGLDPVGSCVGQRGTRVQAILAEVGEEKIDITIWDENPDQFIVNALSPAQVSRVERHEEEKHAIVFVEEDQLSLAIGRAGQNVRLASKITGYTLDVERADGVARTRKTDEPVAESAEPTPAPAEATPEATPEETPAPAKAAKAKAAKTKSAKTKK